MWKPILRRYGVRYSFKKREYALQLSNNYVEIDKDEMEYVDGGDLTAGQKAIIVGAVAIGDTLCWYMQVIIGDTDSYNYHYN